MKTWLQIVPKPAARAGLVLVAAGILWYLTSQGLASAQDAEAATELTMEDLVGKVEEVQKHADVVWTMVAAALVFFMQAGFAMVESGFTRAKNATNIMLKNLMDFAFGVVVFWLVGFGLMFGTSGGFFGSSWFAFGYAQGSEVGSWPFTFFCFQMVFAATAATIVSGAMAERTKFIAYVLYSIVISSVIYPISGGWAWNGLFEDYNGGTAGWLENLGYVDYAGSGVVHLCGGAAALAGAVAIGPRTGKFGPNGEPRAIPGHNLPMGMLGVFILFFGWIGFNAGSTTAASVDIGWIAMNTFLAGGAGAIAAMITSWIVFKKPDMSFTANGVLAGLVGITAPCDTASPGGSVIIGLVAGALVVGSALFLENVLKVDDPVGAVSVHGTCGIWGVLAAGIPFLAKSGAEITWGTFGVQILGALAYALWPFITCLILFTILKATVGLRVTPEEEVEGLDIGEHGNVAYPDFAAIATEE